MERREGKRRGEKRIEEDRRIEEGLYNLPGISHFLPNAAIPQYNLQIQIRYSTFGWPLSYWWWLLLVLWEEEGIGYEKWLRWGWETMAIVGIYLNLEGLSKLAFNVRCLILFLVLIRASIKEIKPIQTSKKREEYQQKDHLYQWRESTDQIYLSSSTRILYSIFYILYSIFYILYSIFYILYSIFYILYYCMVHNSYLGRSKSYRWGPTFLR